MTLRTLQRWVLTGAMVILPGIALAQEAALKGTVHDESGAALPGVVLRLVHESSGNTFEVVTDARGDYRLPLRIGSYKVNAELPGFAPLARQVTLLVGQEAVLNLRMSVSGLAETITVTGAAPLIRHDGVEPRREHRFQADGRAAGQWPGLGGPGDACARRTSESHHERCAE